MPESTATTRFCSLVDETSMLIHETALYHTSPAVSSVLREAAQITINIRRRLQSGIRRYVVAMVGLSNVGKSTLLNALLGDDLAPRRNGPCTAAPIEFAYANETRVTVFYYNSVQRPSYRCHDVNAIHSHLQELADDSGAQASRNIRKVLVEVPHPILANGLVIADTPGFGAAQVGGAAGSHEEALKNYLHDDVSQIFWVVLAEQGIGRREQLFHRDFLAEICDDVLVTGSEDWSVSDQNRFRQRFSSELGQRLPRFHFVSGLLGLRARAAGDAAGLTEAGITRLESRFKELADPASRQSAQVANLIQLCKDLADWFTEYTDERGLPLAVRWRPDSWSRWLALVPQIQLKGTLTKILEPQP